MPARPLSSDTSPEAEAVRFTMLGRMSPAQKAARVAELTDAACRWSLAGLRERHPCATEHELLLRLSVLRLGAETVRRAYGWPADSSGA